MATRKQRKLEKAQVIIAQNAVDQAKANVKSASGIRNKSAAKKSLHQAQDQLNAVQANISKRKQAEAAQQKAQREQQRAQRQQPKIQHPTVTTTKKSSHPVMKALTAPTRISNNVSNQVGKAIMGGGGSGISRGDEAWQMNHDQALRNADACRNAGNYQGAKMWENEANK